MTNLKTIKVTHTKIGEVTLPVNQNGRPQYDEDIIYSILLAGISVLRQDKKISDAEKEILELKITEADIFITENPTSGISIAYNYYYNRFTGKLYDISIAFDSNNSHFDIDDTINSILSTLCDIVLSAIHPQSNINRGLGDGSKGSQWDKYALALLPQERVTKEIFRAKLRRAALDYFDDHVDQTLTERLVEDLGDDWKDYLAGDYVENVFDELNDIEELKNGEYMDVEVYMREVVLD